MSASTCHGSWMKHACARATGPLILGLVGTALAVAPAYSQKKYSTGASDSEIKLGQTMPFSGPASSYALIGRVMTGYFRMVNEVQGGINGRKVSLESLDDAYNPTKTVEQTRKLVENDEVLAIAGSLGSPTNLAIARYLNNAKVPQILIQAGSSKLNDPTTYPWTTTFYSSADVESRIYAEYLKGIKPDANIAVLYQNDDFGRNYLSGLKNALASTGGRIIKEVAYNLTDPTIDSQMISLKASNADVLFIAATPKFSAQAIRRAHEMEWIPVRIVVTAASQVQTVLKQAGFEASKGLLTSQWIKQAGDPLWDEDLAMKDFVDFMKKWVSGSAPDDASANYAYSTAQIIHEVLRRCGDDLTRDNLIKQATNISDYQLPLFIPGVKVNVTPTSRIGWRQGQMSRFDGSKWVLFDDVVTIPETVVR